MYTIRFLLYQLIRFYELIILVQCILSWFAMGSEGIVRDIYLALSRITEPFVGIFRRLLPEMGVGGAYIDFSPMIAIFVLYLIRMIIL